MHYGRVALYKGAVIKYVCMYVTFIYALEIAKTETFDFFPFFILCREESENWVTSENLEEKITYCLEHETSYNFALSPTGEKHYSTSLPGCIDTVENAPGPAAQYPTGLPSRSAN